ncbi:MAG: triose-phosphate isomerase [Thermoplasmata archaeon]|nr:triose-phosphate isomerase [Thermoplasmata archaeon]
MRLARVLERVSERLRVPAAICPASADLGTVAALVSIPVLAQHTDPDPPGAHTGRLVAEAVRAAGCSGSLVNHSERPLGAEEVARVVQRLAEAGLAAIVCARDLAEVWRMAALHPPYLAIEPPELIGGDVSVSTARPELIVEAVEAVREVSLQTQLLVGAGIHRREDVSMAMQLGAKGVLVASGVVRSTHPDRALHLLLEGLANPPGAPRRSGGVASGFSRPRG